MRTVGRGMTFVLALGFLLAAGTLTEACAQPKAEASAAPSAAPSAKPAAKQDTASAQPAVASKKRARPQARSTPQKSPIPPVLAEIEKKYSEEHTLQADFKQVEMNAVIGREKTSTGKIFVKQPNKIRWETLSPDKNLFVTNGKTYWFYTPPFDEGEQGQLIERKSNEINSRMMNALISGSFSKAKGVKIKELAPDQFELAFKKGSAGTITKSIVSLNLKAKLIKEVALEHDGGNHSTITLSNISLGGPIEDSVFTFVAPKGTERVK